MQTPEGYNIPAPRETGAERLSSSFFIDEMQRIAPPHQESLDTGTIEKLRELTLQLLDLRRPQAEAEYERFRSVESRGLILPKEALSGQLAGKRILVTGGTGCIGTVLLNELAQFNPSHIVSISRGVKTGWKAVPDVRYGHVDIRDTKDLERLFQKVKPDIVYHLAAQHDPGIAEREVEHTLTTNIVGTKNVIEAARVSQVQQIVYASTGKALRPFTPDTYAASKKASELLMAYAVARGDIRGAGVRFTHVVDNSIIHRRLRDWIVTDRPIRLHGADIMFYMQSARESAHLLLNAGLEAKDGEFNIQAISNLEWPVNLVDLALGAVSKANTKTPIYFAGFEAGYEAHVYPALYDPLFSGEISPLINAFEAPQTKPSASCPEVDYFTLRASPTRLVREKHICKAGDSIEALHSAKNGLSWAILDSYLQGVPYTVLQNIAKRTQAIPAERFSAEHTYINRAVQGALYQQRV